MEVTMKQILDAVPGMSKLMAADLPLRTAHRLSLMADGLNTHLRFFEQRRDAIKGTEREAERIAELLAFPVEIDSSQLDIPLSEEIRLSAGDIQSLQPFVRFCETEPSPPPEKSEVDHV